MAAWGGWMPISGIITEGVFVCNPISNTEEEGVVLCLSIPKKSRSDGLGVRGC